VKCWFGEVVVLLVVILETLRKPQTLEKAENVVEADEIQAQARAQVQAEVNIAFEKLAIYFYYSERRQHFSIPALAII
jgi:hypothetical protein